MYQTFMVHLQRARRFSHSDKSKYTIHILKEIGIKYRSR